MAGACTWLRSVPDARGLYLPHAYGTILSPVGAPGAPVPVATKLVTLDPGSVAVKLPPNTVTGVCCARSSVLDVIHGVTDGAAHVGVAARVSKRAEVIVEVFIPETRCNTCDSRPPTLGRLGSWSYA